MALKLGYGGKRTSISRSPEGEQDESGLGYAVRNIAKTPTVVAESIGSGFGLGDVLGAANRGLRNVLLGEELSNVIEPYVRQRSIPTGAEVNKALSGVLPKYLTEHKPEDYVPRLIQGEIAPFLASGGLSAPLKTGTTIAGSHLGSFLGQTGAEIAGLGDVGQTSASLIGGIGGGLSASKLGKNRPSRELFNKDKALRVKQYEKSLAELEKSRASNYAQAEKAAKGIRVEAPDVVNVIQEVESGSLHGVDPAERTKILDKLNQLENQLHDGKLSLEVAKQFKKNINSSIYDRNLSPVLKKYYGDINRGLNKFIARVGELHPEHGKAFELAEQQTAELANLKKQDINAIKNEKYKDFVHRIFNQEEGAIIQAVKESGPKLSLSDAALGAISTAAGWFGGLKTGGLVGAGLAGVRGASNEVRTIYKILKSNPSLRKEFKDATVAAIKKDYPVFISKMQKFDTDLNAKLEKKKQPMQGKLKLGY